MKRIVHQYSEASLAEALKEIRSGKMSIRKASKMYGVPVSTLHNKVSGRVADGPRRMGPNTVLSLSEEKNIVEWLLNTSKCGFPQKPGILLDMVQKIIRDEKRKTPFKDDRPGRKWYYSFLKRHKGLNLRKPEAINKSETVVTEDNIRKWFHDLEEYLTAENCHDILQDPSRTFNGDETLFSISPETDNIIGPKCYRSVSQVKSRQEKDTLTVFLVFSASGETLPPMVILPNLCQPEKVMYKVPNDWILVRSENGCMGTETFYEYIVKGYNDWLDKNNIKKPVLFLVDGHKSHMSLQISEFCKKKQIILYSLPPDTTNILHPANVGAFRRLKNDYKETVSEWHNLPENFGKALNKNNFCELLKIVLDKTDQSDIVRNSFRKCGIFPFNANTVDYTKWAENPMENFRVCEPNEVSYTTSQTLNFSNEKYEAAIEVILSIEAELIQKNIDPKVILETIKEAQESNRYNDVVPASDDFVPLDHIKIEEEDFICDLSS